MESINHLYIIVDQNFNISSHVGIPVNGIIGSSVFNNLFEINYEKKGSFYKTTVETEKDRKKYKFHYYRRIKTVCKC
jgi:hypothetical protein